MIADLVQYVEEGGGFVPVHSASGNFRDSDEYIALLGGAFASHGVGTFSTRIAEPDHPVMKGFTGFASWDETYVHQKHNEENRRSEEHTSELQSRGHLVCRLLLEKKTSIPSKHWASPLHRARSPTTSQGPWEWPSTPIRKS